MAGAALSYTTARGLLKQPYKQALSSCWRKRRPTGSPRQNPGRGLSHVVPFLTHTASIIAFPSSKGTASATKRAPGGSAGRAGISS
jgi:hypothetical protein